MRGTVLLPWPGVNGPVLLGSSILEQKQAQQLCRACPGGGDTSDPVPAPASCRFNPPHRPPESEGTADRLQGTNSSRPVLYVVMLGSPLGLVIPNELENDPPKPWDLGMGPSAGKSHRRR